MNITTRAISELTDREQDQMRRWTEDVLARHAAHKRMKAVRAARDEAENVGKD